MAILVVGAAYIGVIAHLLVIRAPDFMFAVASATMLIMVATIAFLGTAGAGRS